MVVENSGALPKDFAKKYYSRITEVYLSTEWNRQARNLARLFARELNLTEKQYIDSLPEFKSQPKEYRGRLDVPVIVETRVPLMRMLELAGIINGHYNADPIPVDSIKDWRKNNFSTPKKPYTVYLNNVGSFLERPLTAARKPLENDEREGTIFDGIAFHLKDPKILEYFDLSFQGSRVDFDGTVPCLSRWYGQADLDKQYIFENHIPGCEPVVAGRKINVKS